MYMYLMLAGLEPGIPWNEHICILVTLGPMGLACCEVRVSTFLSVSHTPRDRILRTVETHCQICTRIGTSITNRVPDRTALSENVSHVEVWQKLPSWTHTCVEPLHT